MEELLKNSALFLVFMVILLAIMLMVGAIIATSLGIFKHVRKQTPSKGIKSMSVASREVQKRLNQL